MKTRTIALLAALLLITPACDQDDGNDPVDVAVEDVTGGDTGTDVDPGDVPVDPTAEEAGMPDGEDDAEPDGIEVLPDPGTYRETVTVDGMTRSYVIVVPETAVAAMPSGRVPFLIGLHGAGDTGENFINATGLTALAAANAFVVVGPDGYNRGWFVERAEGWPGTDGNDTSLQNDIDYMFELIDIGYSTYGIDRNRIYVTGHSRGAGMTGLLAIGSGHFTTTRGTYESPFAAYVVNAGYDATGGGITMSVSRPKRPIWVIHGTADSTVPYSAGESFATALTAAGWDCTWTSVAGAGHTWLFQSSMGQTNQDLWDYFAANPLP
jgi:poly(3-hydroxybutyrate) depolymerase